VVEPPHPLFPTGGQEKGWGGGAGGKKRTNRARNSEQCREVSILKISSHVLLLDRPEAFKPHFSEFFILSLFKSFRLEITNQHQGCHRPSRGIACLLPVGWPSANQTSCKSIKKLAVREPLELRVTYQTQRFQTPSPGPKGPATISTLTH